MPSERDPLNNPNNYYFLNKSSEHYSGVGTTNAVRDGDGGLILEDTPPHATAQEFAPRPVGNLPKHPSEVMSPSRPTGRKGFLETIFGLPSGSSHGHPHTSSSRSNVPQKVRKAPIKIEPKVFFANERTFLAWMHLSVILAGASIAILAFAETDDNNESWLQNLYGIFLLPTAISFIVYSMYQYQRRARMIRLRLPGPYEDVVGPVLLGILLMVSITGQFALKLYLMNQ